MSSRNNFSISVCFALFSFQGTPELISLRSINSKRFPWLAPLAISLRETGNSCSLSASLASQVNPILRLSTLVGLSGLEPPTSRLSGVRSNRLSYKPISWFERWFPTLPGPAASYPPVGPPAFFFRRAPFSNCPPQVWWR